MKPNLIIIGSMKGGTTSLHDYLESHPEISMSRPKEVNFFSNPKYWNRGFRWYETHFRSNARIRGETSTSYTVHPLIKHVPQRIKQFVPDSKLIYVVRDPIDRFVSHYVHKVSEGREPRSFPEAVDAVCKDHNSPYYVQSAYGHQLEQYLKVFNQQQIQIIVSKSLRTDRSQTLQRIARFLDVPDSFPEERVSQEHHRSSDAALDRNWWTNLVFPYWLQVHPRLPWIVKAPFFRLAKLGSGRVGRPALENDLVTRLMELFRPEVERLKRLSGLTFPQWRPY